LLLDCLPWIGHCKLHVLERMGAVNVLPTDPDWSQVSTRTPDSRNSDGTIRPLSDFGLGILTNGNNLDGRLTDIGLYYRHTPPLNPGL